MGKFKEGDRVRRAGHGLHQGWTGTYQKYYHPQLCLVLRDDGVVGARAPYWLIAECNITLMAGTDGDASQKQKADPVYEERWPFPISKPEPEPEEVIDWAKHKQFMRNL